MTSLELLQEIDAWLSFNNSPSKEQISELRNDIKKHISEQLNILHVSVSYCIENNEFEHYMDIDAIGYCHRCGSRKKYER